MTGTHLHWLETKLIKSRTSFGKSHQAVENTSCLYDLSWLFEIARIWFSNILENLEGSQQMHSQTPPLSWINSYKSRQAKCKRGNRRAAKVKCVIALCNTQGYAQTQNSVSPLQVHKMVISHLLPCTETQASHLFEKKMQGERRSSSSSVCLPSTHETRNELCCVWKERWN